MANLKFKFKFKAKFKIKWGQPLIGFVSLLMNFLVSKEVAIPATRHFLWPLQGKPTLLLQTAVLLLEFQAACKRYHDQN